MTITKWTPLELILAAGMIVVVPFFIIYNRLARVLREFRA